ncbi:hypothetical protein [Salmon gill poxvirus]
MEIDIGKAYSMFNTCKTKLKTDVAAGTFVNKIARVLCKENSSRDDIQNMVAMYTENFTAMLQDQLAHVRNEGVKEGNKQGRSELSTEIKNNKAATSQADVVDPMGGKKVKQLLKPLPKKIGRPNKSTEDSVYLNVADSPGGTRVLTHKSTATTKGRVNTKTVTFDMTNKNTDEAGGAKAKGVKKTTEKKVTKKAKTPTKTTTEKTPTKKSKKLPMTIDLDIDD